MSETLEAPAAHATDGHYVTFHVEKELFGVPLAEVQEIIRMPDLVKVPLSPPSLEGIANLRGTVLPISSLRRTFGVEDIGHDDATRVVVLNRDGSPVGFVVDRMASVVTADSTEIESAETLEHSLRSDLLQGVVKRESGMILLLEPAHLAASASQAEASFGTRATLHDRTAIRPADEGGAAAVVLDEVQLVSFEAAGQEYAFPIGDVQEIVQVPGRITTVPQLPHHILGVMTLRDRLLPLVSLRRMFGLAEAPVHETARIVVVALGGGTGLSVGIVMDTVKEVLRVNRSLIDPVPALLGGSESQGGGSEFEAICRLDAGARLVTILSVERMFTDRRLHAALAEAATDTPARQAPGEDPGMTDTATADGSDDEEQVVVFRLDGEEYGVPIDAVQEIVRVPSELTHLPKAAAFMEGVVNLRGTVLPVVDQRRRFALAEAVRNDRQRIMVLTIAGVKTGFIVDSVSEVLKIRRSAIEPAPHLSAEQARLVRRVANLPAEKRMILLLEPANLLETEEIDVLGTV